MAFPGSSGGGKGNYNFKIVLLGEGCVGKTSCVVRYVEDNFNPKHVTTLQASTLQSWISSLMLFCVKFKSSTFISYS